MRILVVNPNTTASMTEKIGTAARAVAAQGTEIIAVNPADGPVSIEGYYDEVFSVPGLLAEIANFFEVYKLIEPNKESTVGGWNGAAEAEQEIADAIARYVP